MEIAWGTAIAAGFIGTLAMTVLMFICKRFGVPLDFPWTMGLMFTGPQNRRLVYAIGLFLNFVNGSLFGIIYASLFLLRPAGLRWGAIFGFFHGLVAGMFIGVIPAIHPRVGPGKVLPPPGLFAQRVHRMAPIELVLLHIVFGLVVGAVYSR